MGVPGKGGRCGSMTSTFTSGSSRKQAVNCGFQVQRFRLPLPRQALVGWCHPGRTKPRTRRRSGAARPARSAGLARAVHDQTEGNPFFVGEVVRLLASEGRLSGTAAGGWDPARFAARVAANPLDR